jgi:hypothetical protein
MKKSTKKISKAITCIAVIMIFSSCATIITSSRCPLNIRSNPLGAKVEITNRNGMLVFEGTTPSSMLLKSGAGFFKKEHYTIRLTMDGYAEKVLFVNCTLNGWYFGNIVFGGIIGLLIVDPATGAMYRLDTNYASENLNPVTVGKPTLQILDINDISSNMKSHLVSLK